MSKPYGTEEAIQKGIEIIEERIKNNNEIQIEEEKIINKQINTYEKEGYIDVEVTYEVLENIGTKEKIVF